MGRIHRLDVMCSYGYENGVFAYMQVMLKNHVLKSVKREGTFSSTNTVERIVLYSTFQPTRMFFLSWLMCRCFCYL